MLHQPQTRTVLLLSFPFICNIFTLTQVCHIYSEILCSFYNTGLSYTKTIILQWFLLVMRIMLVHLIDLKKGRPYRTNKYTNFDKMYPKNITAHEHIQMGLSLHTHCFETFSRKILNPTASILTAFFFFLTFLPLVPVECFFPALWNFSLCSFHFLPDTKSIII